jgi:2-aminoethylphosphonate-pyruvate transaminase
MNQRLPVARDKLLFTPGPLTTSLSVKQAMLHDAGSWHHEFGAVVEAIRGQLLALAGVSRADGYEAVLMQGSGTFGVEAVLASVLPPEGKLLVIANGAYGERIVQMARRLKIEHVVQRCAEDAVPDHRETETLLRADAAISHVALVHCETTSGILNPLESAGEVVRAAGRSFIVDAMSSFGAIPVSITGSGIDYLVASPNKCLEGVPGFSFVIARRAALLASDGCARSLSLDLLDQLRGFEKNGQFRFTPPTHALLACARALEELELEGGISARGARYRRNQEVLVEGMKRMGFRPWLAAERQSFIITAFHFPESPEFDFDQFYQRLSARGFIIYPGKLTRADTFRIGSIGRIFEADITALLAAIRGLMHEMGVMLMPTTPPNHAAPDLDE